MAEPPRFSLVEGDVRGLHLDPSLRGVVVQVASQGNCLEMVGPGVSPEDGVTRYAQDRTQGPACAMAAGAATIWRNYAVEVDGERGQTADRQLDAFADLRAALARAAGVEPDALWRPRNGYVLPDGAALDRVASVLRPATAADLDRLRGCLRIGLHWDVEATDAAPPGPLLTQAFCSALPVAYGPHAPGRWEPLARLVLEAAYEATLLAGALDAARGGPGVVLLTRLGGGAFGNPDAWIDDAIARAVALPWPCGLDVRLVSHGAPPRASLRLQDRLQAQVDPPRAGA